MTTTSSQTGKMERMLASIGKSSLIAFLTMVKPETLTTIHSPQLNIGDPISLDPRGRGKRGSAHQGLVEPSGSLDSSIEREGFASGPTAGSAKPQGKRLILKYALDCRGPRTGSEGWHQETAHLRRTKSRFPAAAEAMTGLPSAIASRSDCERPSMREGRRTSSRRS